MKVKRYARTISLILLIVAICLCSGCGQEEVSKDTSSSKATKTSLISILDSEEKDAYKEAIEAILQEDETGYESAIELLDGLEYKDSELLFEYAKLRQKKDDYIGDAQSLVQTLNDRVPDTHDVKNRNVRKQIESFGTDIAEIAVLQNSIDSISRESFADVNSFSNGIDSLQAQVDSLENEHKNLLKASRLKKLRKDADKEIEKEKKAEEKRKAEAEKKRKAAEKKKKEKEAREKEEAKKAWDNARVYITPTGNCYHDSGCRYIKDDSPSLTRAEARKRGLYACSKCNADWGKPY